MYFVSLNVNCGERPCRTQILAGTTSDASFFIDSRNHQRLRVIRILPHHPYRTGRTVTGAVAATYSVGIYHAIVQVDHGVSYLYR